MINPTEFFRYNTVSAHGPYPAVAELIKPTALVGPGQRWRVLAARLYMSTNVKATDGLDHYIGVSLEDADGYIFAEVIDFVKGATARPYFTTPWMTLGDEGSIGRQRGSALYLRQRYLSMGTLVDGFVGVDFVARIEDL